MDMKRVQLVEQRDGIRQRRTALIAGRWAITGGLGVVAVFVIVIAAVEVQKGAAAAGYSWLSSWLLDPVVGVALVVLLGVSAVLSTYGAKVPGVVRAGIHFCGAATLCMNAGPHLAVDRPGDAFWHAVPPVLLMFFAGGALKVWALLGQQVADCDRKEQRTVEQLARHDRDIEDRRAAAAEAERTRAAAERDAARARERQDLEDAERRARWAAQEEDARKRREEEAASERRIREAEALAALERERLEAEVVAARAKAAAERDARPGPRAVAAASSSRPRATTASRAPAVDLPPDLIERGRKVAQDLADADIGLSKRSLIDGFRERGESISSDRAAALTRLLKAAT